MTQSQAQKWAEVFELMSDWRKLVLLVHIMEANDYVSLAELADVAKTSESKTRQMLTKMEKEYLVDEEVKGDYSYYKMTNGRQANFVEMVLEKLT